MLKGRIEEGLKNAMKQKNTIMISCLRMLKADMLNLSIQKKEDLKDDDIVKVIQKLVRQHKDSIDQFKKGGRDDLADKEAKELSVLESYLPKQLSEDELAVIIKSVISSLGASTKKDMGVVMKEVMERTKGASDGKSVSRIVATFLK